MHRVWGVGFKLRGAKQPRLSAGLVGLIPMLYMWSKRVTLSQCPMSHPVRPLAC
jgi:hypothetical protein